MRRAEVKPLPLELGAGGRTLGGDEVRLAEDVVHVDGDDGRRWQRCELRNRVADVRGHESRRCGG
jgi:hypothetical protein